ncbi:MAG: hypothetical protein QOJ59_2167 [Thermomicrobiales bacterium]|nr:hypothetical protein [Thermomicrobiales bacterium]
MAKRLEGVGFRVFRSLQREWDRDTVEDIRVELTRGTVVSYEEVEDALRRLADQRYVEEFSPGHWRISANGLALRQTLLGEHGDGDDPPTCVICGALITESRGGELVRLSERDGLVWIHPACRGRQLQTQ